jgi:hypothetical protein
MANLLLIVSKDEPDSFNFLKKAFGGRKDIDIVVDRRAGQAPVVGRDRRARKNDDQLRTYGWVLIRRPPGARLLDGRRPAPAAARAGVARPARPTKRAMSRRRRTAKRRGSSRPRPRRT